MGCSWTAYQMRKSHPFGRSATYTNKLIVDGNEAQTWNDSQCLDVPKEITFGGRQNCYLTRKGLLKPSIDSF
jgi:hypothetical protein